MGIVPITNYELLIMNLAICVSNNEINPLHLCAFASLRLQKELE